MRLPGEEDDKCCWCIPIKCGVYIIGIECIVNAIKAGLLFFFLVEHTSLINQYTILAFVALLQLCYSCLLFMMFFLRDNTNTRRNLKLACIMCILSMSVYIIFYLLLYFLDYYSFEEIRNIVI